MSEKNKGVFEIMREESNRDMINVNEGHDVSSTAGRSANNKIVNINKRYALNKMFDVISCLLILVLMISSISALGITPGRTTIDYEKGLEKEVSFSVLNNEHKNMKVMLMVKGELNQSVTLYDNMVEFLPSEESRQFNYKVSLSEDIAEDPGLHTAEIVALEIPEADERGTYVGATVAVVSQLYVNVPCPGKCIESDLNVLDAEENSTATFIVPVINRGKLGIGDVRALIDIYNLDYEKKASLDTDSSSLEPGKRTELSAKWDVDLNSGNYIAKVTVFYDGESRNFEKQFSVGKNMLSIESILVNNFQLGEIAKLQILVENRWNQELESVYANLLVYNYQNQVMADIKSAAENLEPLTKKELLAYWDTVGVEEGEYDGKLMVRYGEKSSDKNLVLKVKQDSLDITGVGYAIKGRDTKGVDMTTILLILVILLLMVNLAWFVFFRMMIGKRKK